MRGRASAALSGLPAVSILSNKFDTVGSVRVLLRDRSSEAVPLRSLSFELLPAALAMRIVGENVKEFAIEAAIVLLGAGTQGVIDSHRHVSNGHVCHKVPD
jgi:hypothetical protein